MRNIVILGSTGSIGENALRIVESLPDSFRVIGLAAGSNAELAAEQARRFGVPTLAMADAAAARRARELVPPGCRVLAGEAAVRELAAQPEADLVVCAVVGVAALGPVLAAIEAGHDVAIATKEVLVAAGALVCQLCERKGVALLPIDSEHSAIFQCMQDRDRLPWCVRRGAPPTQGGQYAPLGRVAYQRWAPPTQGGQYGEEAVERLILTASGGPFAAQPELDLARVTPAAALNHPRWSMGPKVTVDSATMMNKGLEIIEAHWLFNIPISRIEVLLHPQSIVHSLVEFHDGAQIAQLGEPDMRTAIQYAMSWPRRLANATLPRLNLATLGGLTFAAPDQSRFPCLSLARAAGEAGGSAPAVMNAANEVAVEAFLQGRISFPSIWGIVEATLAAHDVVTCDGLEEILATDIWARQKARSML